MVVRLSITKGVPARSPVTSLRIPAVDQRRFDGAQTEDAGLLEALIQPVSPRAKEGRELPPRMLVSRAQGGN
jgi:hypothetical protein